MKIVIASGIFIPELGGPATYAANISQEFINLGHQISVVAYSDKNSYDFDSSLGYPVFRVKRSHKIANYFNYYKTLIKIAKDADVIYTFDHFSAGMPAALFCKLYKKPLYIRVGGDFIWERYIDISGHLLTLREFYDKGLYKGDMFRFNLIKQVFRAAKGIIFTTNFQKEIFSEFYDLEKSKLKIIENPVINLKDESKRENISKDIIFAGRFNVLHNIFNLIMSFKEVRDKNYHLFLIGDGQIKKDIISFIKDENLESRVFVKNKLSREDLRKRISDVFLVVLPALTDISPNLVLECINTKTPFITSKEIGFDWLKNKVISFDPKNVAEMTEKINYLLDNDNYQSYQKQISELVYNYTYKEAASDTIKIFQ